MADRKCLHCGKPFKRTYRPGRPKGFCSPECKKARTVQQMKAVHKKRHKKQKQERRKRRTCPLCKKRYYVPIEMRLLKYCSKTCARIARQAQKRDYMRRQRSTDDPAPPSSA